MQKHFLWMPGYRITTVAEPENYDARANLVWCATLALCGVVGSGLPHHGQTLAIVLPALLKERRGQKPAKLLQYAELVWQIGSGTEEEKIDLAIQKTREFFESLGVKTHLSQYGVEADKIPVIVEQLKDHGLTALSETQDLTLDISQKIIESAM